jgi:hypothetical protein
MLDPLLSMAAIAILQPCYFAILDVTSPRLDDPDLIVVSRGAAPCLNLVEIIKLSIRQIQA